MITTPVIPGILDPHPDGMHLCIKCPWCSAWHSAPAADMAPGQKTHLVARCTVPGGPYRESGYVVKIISKRTRRSRSCARGHFRWSRRKSHLKTDRPTAPGADGGWACGRRK